MEFRLKEVLSVSRGLHVLKPEKNEDNLKNSNINIASILNFDDIKDYACNSDNTINYEKEKKKAFINLKTRYRNSTARSYDLIISRKSFYIKPRIVIICADDKNNYIYANEALYLRSKVPDDFLDIKYVYYLLSTQKVQDIINNAEKNLSRRELLENIKCEIPNLEEQKKFVHQMEDIHTKFENFIK